jgi:hypothetical protein
MGIPEKHSNSCDVHIQMVSWDKKRDYVMIVVIIPMVVVIIPIT